MVSPEKTDPGISELSFNVLPVSGVEFGLGTGNPGLKSVSAGVNVGLDVAGILDLAGRYLRSNGFPEDWPQTTDV